MPKFAVCQHIPISHDKEANYRTLEGLIVQAAEEGADLVVCPEYCLGLPTTEHQNWTDDGEYLTKFRDLATKLRINLVPGTLGQVQGDQVYNVAHYIDRTGTILQSYRKLNLWHPEREIFEKGDNHLVFETEFGKVGILICWDLAFPEAFRELVHQGVRVVVAPTCWSYEDAGAGLKFNRTSEGIFLDALCVTRAFENGVILVFANCGSVDETHCGKSQITAPFYGRVAGIDGCERGVVCAEVDMECLEIAEQVYRIRKDLGSEDWHYN